MNEHSEAALRERIDETRTRMSHTIEQIGDRVNPDRVKADLKARAREQVHEMKSNVKQKARNTMRNVEHGVSDAGRGIWATIRENPLPAGMIGVGLAWLLKNRRSGHEYERFDTFSARAPYRTGFAEPSYGESYERGVAADIEYGRTTTVEGSTAFGTTGSTQWQGDGSQQERGLREKASERVSEVKNRVGDAAHQAQDRIGSLAHRAKDRAREVPRNVENRMQENPVAAGAMALAIGMAAGMMIPESEREHRMFGHRRDQLLDKAQDTARRAGEKLHDAAREAAGESARSMVDDVWPGGEENAGSEGISEPRR